MRLNGWQRIGLVLTVCWIVAGGLWVNYHVIEDEGASATAEYRRCLDLRSVQPDGSVPKDTDWGPCQRSFDKDFSAAIANHWYVAAALTLIPIPMVWLIVYGLVALVRGLKPGSRRTPRTRTLLAARRISKLSPDLVKRNPVTCAATRSNGLFTYICDD